MNSERKALQKIPVILSVFIIIGLGAANGAPLLSNIESTPLNYTEGQGQALLTGTINVSGYSILVLSATIHFTSGFNISEDVLSFHNAYGINSNWDAGKATLTLSGAASYSNYQQALRSIYYENTNKANPDVNPRIVTLNLTDLSGTSNSVSRRIDVLPVNSVPAILISETSPLAWCFRGLPGEVVNSLSITDADNHTLSSAKIQFSEGYVSNEDVLYFTNQNNISGSWNSQEGILLLNGISSLENYRQALGSIVYENTSESGIYHPSVKKISFIVNDGIEESNKVYRNIEMHNRVNATLTGSTGICLTDDIPVRLEVQLTGSPPWKVEVLKDNNDYRTFRDINESTFTFDVKEEGTFRIRSVADKYCTGDTLGSGYARIIARPVPTAVLSGLDTVCNGNKGILNISLTGTGPWSVSLLFNGINKIEIGDIRENNYFLQVSDAGTYTLTGVRDAICKGIASGEGTVYHYPVSSAVMSGSTSICEYETAELSITFTGTPPWSYHYKKDNENPVAGTNQSAIAVISASKGGNYTLVDVYDKYCKGSVSGNALINVIPAPSCTIQGLLPAYSKQSSEWIPISGSPEGGTFTGQGVVPYDPDWFFVPALPPVGDHDIVYTYRASPASCYGYDTVKVRILEASAVLEFENNRKKYCINDAPFKVTAKVLIGKGYGSFSISGGSGLTDHGNNTATVYPSMLPYDQYTITFTNTDDTQIKQIIDIGPPIHADFKWDVTCFKATQPVLFTNTSSSTFGFLTDSSHQWKITDKSTTFISNSKDLSYSFSEPASYKVQLQIENSNGCRDTADKLITLYPLISPAEEFYREDFEKNPPVWSKGNDETSSNSWTLGIPPIKDELQQGISGTNCWYTTWTSGPEKSWVTSPCFNLTGMQKPMLTFKIWRLFNNNKVGANLQFTSDGGNTWTPLGNIGDGINWYSGYFGISGAQSVGWTSLADGRWMESRHSLDMLKSFPAVQFRMAFTASDDAQGIDGMAFDNFAITERSRFSLIEHFTNSSLSLSVKADSTLDHFASMHEASVIDIQYHASGPGNDLFYASNPVIPTTRQFYYGLSEVPYGLLNGGNESHFRFNYQSNPLDINYPIIESLRDSKFNLQINAEAEDNLITTHIRIKALQDLSLEELAVRIAVIEREVTNITGENGDADFRNIVKTMLPGAAGLSLYTTWQPGDSMNLSAAGEVQSIYDPQNLAVVAFIQNESTKEIYQADIASVSGFTPVKGSPEDDGFCALSPNPTSARFNLSFNQKTEMNTTVELIDMTGNLLKTWNVPDGTTTYEINAGDFPVGLYLVRISVNYRRVQNYKVLIQR